MSNPLQEHVKGSVFIKRLLVFLAFQIILTIALVFRLFYLQIMDFKNLKNRSESNRVKIDIIPPLRGNIFDRNDNILTNNRVSYELVSYRNKYSLVKNVASILNMAEEKRGR
ncbi:MAG: hypothetical protein LBP39_03770, partial [Rickettsiales bacterium]|nr:hypothetical protein [Rickettsiales bacterium]